jgi:hypothetical protein
MVADTAGTLAVPYSNPWFKRGDTAGRLCRPALLAATNLKKQCNYESTCCLLTQVQPNT